MALGLALVPVSEDVERIRHLSNSFEQAGVSFSFALHQDKGLIPHLSIMQGVFADCEAAMAAVERLDKSEIEPSLSVSDLSIWATKILFLNFRKAQWLMRLHQSVFHLWIAVAQRASADPQKFRGITPGQQASFDNTGYPFSLNEYAPHITVGHCSEEGSQSLLLPINSLLSETRLEEIKFRRLVVFKVEPLGACREIIREWRC